MTAIAPGLFEETPDGPRLLGAACGRCGVVTFPRQRSCPRCTSLDMHDRAPDGAVARHPRRLPVGAKAYVTKPIDEAELTRTINEYLPAN